MNPFTYFLARLWPRKPVVTFASHEFFGDEQQVCIVVVNGRRTRKVHWFREVGFPCPYFPPTDWCDLCPITMKVPCDDLNHGCQENV